MMCRWTAPALMAPPLSTPQPNTLEDLCMGGLAGVMSAAVTTPLGDPLPPPSVQGPIECRLA